jgi:hypothetical protein
MNAFLRLSLFWQWTCILQICFLFTGSEIVTCILCRSLHFLSQESRHPCHVTRSTAQPNQPGTGFIQFNSTLVPFSVLKSALINFVQMYQLSWNIWTALSQGKFKFFLAKHDWKLWLDGSTGAEHVAVQRALHLPIPTLSGPTFHAVTS